MVNNTQTTRFKTAYGPRLRHPTPIVGKSMAHQSMRDECDINRIMERWLKTGVLEHRNRYEGHYGDFLDVPADYHQAANQVLAAQEMFLELPAKVRKRFGNDPGAFLEFVGDPENRSELEKLGLAKPKPPEDLIEDPKKPATGGVPPSSRGNPIKPAKAAPAPAPGEDDPS